MEGSTTDELHEYIEEPYYLKLNPPNDNYYLDYYEMI
jgi:hypothetical protein